MGYIKHHAIAITSGIDELLKKAHVKAKEIFGDRASEILKGETNAYNSFFIAPDGSKEGWEESKKGDRQRELFVEWINDQVYEDGSNSLAFCEFFYGEDKGKAQIENHN